MKSIILLWIFIFPLSSLAHSLVWPLLFSIERSLAQPSPEGNWAINAKKIYKPKSTTEPQEEKPKKSWTINVKQIFRAIPQEEKNLTPREEHQYPLAIRGLTVSFVSYMDWKKILDSWEFEVKNKRIRYLADVKRINPSRYAKVRSDLNSHRSRYSKARKKVETLFSELKSSKENLKDSLSKNSGKESSSAFKVSRNEATASHFSKKIDEITIKLEKAQTEFFEIAKRYGEKIGIPFKKPIRIAI